MYFDKRKRILPWIIAALVLVVLLAAAVFFFQRATAGDIRQEAEHSIRETIRRTALECLAVEGVYPASLRYLEENYGLQINKKDYYVVYEVFADNLPPNIRVARKER